MLYTIQNYSNNSILSQAAYANLSDSKNDDTTRTNKEALIKQDFTSSQAEEFLNKYEIVDQYSNATTGTRITLFEEIATGKTTTTSLTKHTNRLCCFKL